MDFKVKKLSKDLKTKTTLIKPLDSTWNPRCVHYSVSTGDLLVGVCREPDTLFHGKVIRYNRFGQLTQTIEYRDTEQPLYYGPSYITENNNGDVVVSDWKLRVVVTERKGRHRFTYTGDPIGSVMMPLGICTDALSNILMCATNTSTVMMLDKDGQFLSHLMMMPLFVFHPQCLCYDMKTHRLWVGSSDSKSKVIVNRYITHQDAKTGKRHDMDESPPLSFMMDLSTPNVWRRIINPLPFVDLEDYDELDTKVEFEQELSTRESYSSNNPLKHSPQRKRKVRPQCNSFESVEVSTSANNSVNGNICAAQHTQ